MQLLFRDHCTPCGKEVTDLFSWRPWQMWREYQRFPLHWPGTLDGVSTFPAWPALPRLTLWGGSYRPRWRSDCLFCPCSPPPSSISMTYSQGHEKEPEVIKRVTILCLRASRIKFLIFLLFHSSSWLCSSFQLCLRLLFDPPETKAPGSIISSVKNCYPVISTVANTCFSFSPSHSN